MKQYEIMKRYRVVFGICFCLCHAENYPYFPSLAAGTELLFLKEGIIDNVPVVYFRWHGIDFWINKEYADKGIEEIK